jgi:putative phage-type endonuclease
MLLEELINIIDEILPNDISSIFTEEFSLDLIETIFHLIENFIEENPTAISEPDFHDDLLEEIKELLLSQFDEDIFFNEDDEEDLDILIDFAIEVYFATFSIARSIENTINNNEKNSINSIEITNNNEKIDEITNKLIKLRKKPQPVQRTPEWYIFRHNLITASNAYKVFESQAAINQIIYEKCQPLKTNFDDDKSSTMVNVNTTLHWGQKYEPLSVLIYEDMYGTKIEDFGCIEHETHKFLGASPDGINIDPNSDRYGRMLEIKNIVNREINGVPKKEYWIQMQIQMEVWDLDECDFLETKFVEYSDSSSFFNDVKNDSSMKGVIAYFHTKDGRPYYVYKPLNIIGIEEINNWEEMIVDKYQNNVENDNDNENINKNKEKMIWIKNIYWKLEKLSCVLVLRNKKWFQDNIGQIGKIWKTIEEERVTGYEHRAPNRKVKKEKPDDNRVFGSGCLLFSKIIKHE